MRDSIEREVLIAAAPNEWWRVFVHLAYATGFRKGELLNLTWDNVDLDAGEVRVEPKTAGAFKVAGESFPILAWTAKNYDNRITACLAAARACSTVSAATT